MSDESTALECAEKKGVPTLVVIGREGDLQISASTPADMVEANKGLIAWCEAKIQSVEAENAEVSLAYEKAVKNKWGCKALKNQIVSTRRRIEFFSKMKTCLEHGYHIVPNFPVTAFVVRTKKKRPPNISRDYRINVGDTEFKPAPIRQGEGEYQNPFQNVFVAEYGETPNKKRNYFTHGQFMDIEFPMNMAKPHIMTAVERAMALKVFDDIGVLPDPSPKKKDPIIVGRIFNKTSYSREPLTFMICWHLDTRVL
jgi:hypothetical protein